MASFGHRGWGEKFKTAFLGVKTGMVGQSSFYIHVPVAIMVVALMLMLRLDCFRCGILLICIANVIGFELLNSALEKLAKAIDQEFNEWVRDALDIASAAVLVVAMFSVVVGVIILFEPMRRLLENL